MRIPHVMPTEIMREMQLNGENIGFTTAHVYVLDIEQLYVQFVNGHYPFLNTYVDFETLILSTLCEDGLSLFWEYVEAQNQHDLSEDLLIRLDDSYQRFQHAIIDYIDDHVGNSYDISKAHYYEGRLISTQPHTVCVFFYE